MKDVRLDPAGSVVMVQPLTAAAKEWLEENAEAASWAWQGGALAVDARMVAALVDGMTAAGLEVEGYEPPPDPLVNIHEAPRPRGLHLVPDEKDTP